MSASFDCLLVGGGLANGLLAWRLAQIRPDVSFRLIERGPELGAHHTWSFHSSDVSEEALTWLRPLITKSWPYYDVIFPKIGRRLDTGYHSIRSEDFHRVVSEALGERALCEAPARTVERERVTLADGREWQAKAVLDARGFARPSVPCGYQSFFGQDLRLEAPHGLRGPLLMDATCEQRGGFRFFYLLPWSDDTLLVEDTRYIDEPALDPEEARAEIARYVAERGWRIREVRREEAAALPIPLDREAPPLAGGISIGVRAGLFHGTTGYSLPDAVRLVERLVGLPQLNAETVAVTVAQYSREHERHQRYFRFLNRMLFRGAIPDERYRLLQRFYGMPVGTIGRFYAGSMTSLDCARVLCGKPPIPLRAAFQCLFPGSGHPQTFTSQERTA